MSSTLREEINQQTAFTSREHAALLNIERTAAVLEHAFAEAFKPHGIAPTQYNVLRILRGAGKQGFCRNEVRETGSVSKVPDVTRPSTA